MKSLEYWKKREQVNIEHKIQVDANNSDLINDILEEAMKDIEKEILADVSRYAGKEGITISEAMKRADEFDVKDFAKTAKKMVETKDFSPTANKLLRTYNLKMRISRLELLKAKIGLATVAMGEDLIKQFDEFMTEATLTELREQSGILAENMPTDEDFRKQAEKILNGSYKVSGIIDQGTIRTIFSEAIWGDTIALQQDLEKLLFKSLSQGVNPKVLARDLRKTFDTTRYQAERLMRTETARVQGEAQRASYEKYDTKKYIYIAEPTACDICSPLDDKVFKVSEMEVGKNYFPMHPNCKCSTAPYSDRLFEEVDSEEQRRVNKEFEKLLKDRNDYKKERKQKQIEERKAKRRA